MSLERFQQYIAYYDDNKALRDQFRETKRMSFGFLSGDLWWTRSTVCCV